MAVWASVDALRARVNARIRAALSGETGEIAVALITGERGGISEELNQAMRDSGLAHILSISGLHMVIMGLSDVSLVWATLRKGWGLVMGAAVTTLVASAAIAPFAVYHFHRMTHYGLVANMIAAPLVSLLIMPMAVLSLIAMPFGLEVWPLKAMGFGIELMVKAGVWVAGWPGAVTVLPAISGTALVLMVLGGLWLCLWQTRTRALGLVIAAAGLALAPGGQRPDVLIDRDGATAAFRSEGGSLVFPPATAAGYSVDNWLLADGDERDAAAAASEDGAFRCDLLGCIGTVKGKTVALIRHPAALEEDCRLADIVIAPFTIGKTCRAARVIVDRRMLKSEGASALYIEGLSIRTETVAAARGRRPWVPDHAIVRSGPPSSSGHDYSNESGEDAKDDARPLDGNPEE